MKNPRPTAAAASLATPPETPPLVSATGAPLAGTSATAASAAPIGDGAAPPPGTGTAEALATPVDPTTPIKETATSAGGRLMQESVQTTTDRTGEPSSATLSPQPLPIAADRILPGYGAQRRPRAGTAYGGSLPASMRVLANGREEQLTAQFVSTDERYFTAAVRILRNKKLYEPGAPVPLTELEFEAKRDAKAIVETLWSEGDDDD